MIKNVTLTKTVTVALNSLKIYHCTAVQCLEVDIRTTTLRPSEQCVSQNFVEKKPFQNWHRLLRMATGLPTKPQTIAQIIWWFSGQQSCHSQHSFWSLQSICWAKDSGSSSRDMCQISHSIRMVRIKIIMRIMII